MSRWRPVAIQNCSAIGAFGVGLDSFHSWWSNERPDLTSKVEVLQEQWLPFEIAGQVPKWRARDHIPERKAIKLMTRRVQLGVASALQAWGNPDPDRLPAPQRRAMYTGCGVPADEDWTFRLPIDESVSDGRFDMFRFATHGQEFLNPLWLVKSLTNNVLAFSAKTLDLQGANNNFEGDAAGALIAVGEAARGIAEGRADIALAGAGDSLISVEFMLHLARSQAEGEPNDFLPGEGAAFVLMDTCKTEGLAVLGFGSASGPSLTPRIRCTNRSHPQILETIEQARESAWREASPFLSASRPGLRLLGPRIPYSGGACPELRISDQLGDCGAAGGALLLAAACTHWKLSPPEEVIELVAVAPGGEASVLLIGSANPL